jgi:hypothetical protein
MAANDVPKLLINGDPGTIHTGDLLEFCRAWRNQEEVTVHGKPPGRSGQIRPYPARTWGSTRRLR